MLFKLAFEMLNDKLKLELTIEWKVIKIPLIFSKFRTSIVTIKKAKPVDWFLLL